MSHCSPVFRSLESNYRVLQRAGPAEQKSQRVKRTDRDSRMRIDKLDRGSPALRRVAARSLTQVVKKRDYTGIAMTYVIR